MRGKTLHFLFLVSALLIISSTAVAQLSVDPDVVDDASSEIYNISIENDIGEDAENATIILPAPEAITDPFGTVTEENVEVKTDGWEVNKLWSRDSDGYNDAVKISRGSGSSLSKGERVNVELVLDGAGSGRYTWKANLSNEEEYNSTIHIEGDTPERISTSPNGDSIMYPDPDIVAEFQDNGIGVDTSKTQLIINGRLISQDNLAVNEEDEVRYQDADLKDGKNSIAVYVEDGFGHGRWINWSFSLVEDPVINSISPRKGTRNRKPVLEAVVKDPSGLDPGKTHIKFEGDRYDNGSLGLGLESLRSNDTVYKVSYETQSLLENREYQVSIVAYDKEGHRSQENWSFMVDTRPPTINRFSIENGEIFSGSIPIHVEANDEGSRVERTVISIGDTTRTIYNSTFNGHLTIVDDEIDTAAVKDGLNALEIEMYDHAGNSISVSRNVTLDNHPPEIREVRLFPNPTNVAPELRIRTSDNNTGVEEAEYYIGDDPGRGNATAVPLSSESPEINVFSTSINTSILSKGSQEVNVRVKDRAQQWSITETIALEYNPDLESGLQFGEVSPVYISQGERKSFDTYITNTGKVPAKVTLDVESDIEAILYTKTKVIGSGDTRLFSVILAPEAEPIGNYTVGLRAESRASKIQRNLTVVVQANNRTRREIEESVKELSRNYRALRNKTGKWIYSLRYRSEEINKSLKEVESTISAALERMEAGNYRYASKKLPKLIQKLNNTDKALKTGIDDYYNSIFWETILIIVAILITAGFVLFYKTRFIEEKFEGDFEYSASGEELSFRDKLERAYESSVRRSKKLWIKFKRFVKRMLGQEEEGWEGFEYR